MEVKNAKNVTTATPNERILLVGRTGSGKTTQIRTLKGRKFAYIFDPNSMRSLHDLDMDYLEFLPDLLEMDSTLKGFNKNSKSDHMPGAVKKREPTVYMDWVEDINERVENGFFDDYHWIIFDSLTFLARSIMNRQLFINNRYGDLEDLGDYRIVGSKMTEVFSSIAALPLNILCTGHIDVYTNEKTKKNSVELRLPGSSRTMLPLLFTNIWNTIVGEDKDGKRIFEIVTIPDPHGLQDIRTSIPDLEAVIDVTIRDRLHPENYGIGSLLGGTTKAAPLPKKRATK